MFAGFGEQCGGVEMRRVSTGSTPRARIATPVQLFCPARPRRTDTRWQAYSPRICPSRRRAILVERGAGTMDRGRPFGIPAMPFVAHALDADRPAHRLRQQCRIDPSIAGVVAPIGAGARDPDPVDLVLRAGPARGRPRRARSAASANRSIRSSRRPAHRRRRRPAPCWRATGTAIRSPLRRSARQWQKRGRSRP